MSGIDFDFDALLKEFYREKCNKGSCNVPEYMCDNIGCYNNFLKSKNLCAQATCELPMKTIYKIKPEYEAIFVDLRYDEYVAECQDHLPENVKNVEKYYDKITKVDYSAIPYGSIVEVNLNGDVGYRRVHSVGDNGSINLYFDSLNEGLSDCTFQIPSKDIIRVVEWGKE